MQPVTPRLAVRFSRRPAASTRVSHCGFGLNRSREPSRRCFSKQTKQSIAELLRWKPAEKVDDVVVNGFVRSVRSMKAHRFVSLGDGSSLAPLQALVHTDQAQGYEQSRSRHACLGCPNLLIRSLQSSRWRSRPPHGILGSIPGQRAES